MSANLKCPVALASSGAAHVGGPVVASNAAAGQQHLPGLAGHHTFSAAGAQQPQS